MRLELLFDKILFEGGLIKNQTESLCEYFMAMKATLSNAVETCHKVIWKAGSSSLYL